ncbi:MAG: cupin domain-containing protein [Acidobacteriota bacterium]|nr:cupin domain-containing protein [Acidobacteriota bacterium]
MKKILLFVLLVFALFFSFERVSETQTKTEKSLPGQDNNKPKIVAVDTNKLEAFSYDAGKIKFIASSEETNGAFAVMENTELPGYKTTWHRHNHTEETFYVLEGTLTIKMNDKVSEFPAGSYVMVPRGTPHGQGNFSKNPVRFILTVTPGGYERRFRERIDIFKTTKPGDPDFNKKQTESRANVDSEVLGVWDVKK